MPDYEVGTGTCCTTGDSEVAIDQDLPSTGEGAVYKLHNIFNMLSDVCLFNIQESQTFVFYPYRFVEILVKKTLNSSDLYDFSKN